MSRQIYQSRRLARGYPRYWTARLAASGREAARVDYEVPDLYANLDELASSPVQNPDEIAVVRFRSLEETRSTDRRSSRSRGRGSLAREYAGRPRGRAENVHVSGFATQPYTHAYLIVFSTFETLARLGIQALARYPAAPVTFEVLWANFWRTLILRFLAEDMALFRHYASAPKLGHETNSGDNGETNASTPDMGATEQAGAKEALLATKKTIPLYIGLATGFCMDQVSQDGRPTTGPQLQFFNTARRVALLWSSIALAVFTSLLQGLIQRSSRFPRTKVYGHSVSTLLAMSFVMIILTFLAGNTHDSVGVLVLSTATTIAIVRYTIPAWSNRAFIENRWRAWTGPSRAAIWTVYRDLCSGRQQWRRLAEAVPERKIMSAPSDHRGLSLFHPSGLWQDSTAILKKYPIRDGQRGNLNVEKVGGGYHSVYACSLSSL
ncbi:hypothetical protein DL770_007776 [Monosporascus sp. CRB-9-2]|nr:hypothetical protein DL770_007776 [Monosporascus sp. CRB-9-2]